MSDLWPRHTNNEAQRMVLSCIFIDPSLSDDDSMKNITIKHFTDSTMAGYYKLVVNGDRLPMEVIMACNEDLALPDFFRRYVLELKKEWIRHWQAKYQAQAEALLDKGDIKKANAMMVKSESLSLDDEWIRFTEGYEDIFKQKQQEIKDGVIASIQTGFHMLDRVTGGMHKGQLWVVGAGVNHGKTTFAVQVSRNVAKAGKKVGVFSLCPWATVSTLLSRSFLITYHGFSGLS